MAQTAQERRAAQRRNAKSVKSGGKNAIAGIVPKTSRKVASTRNGPKATETDHLRSDQFSGKHHAPSSYASVTKNNNGGSNGGKHSKEVNAYTPKHAGAFDHFRDLAQVIKRGGASMGKHSKSWI